MTARIMNGKEIAQTIREELKEKVAQLEANHGMKPGLAVVLVGEDPASQTYVGGKAKACAEVGFYSEVIRLPASTSQEALLSIIDDLNKNTNIHGILVQLPLPKHIAETSVIEAISPEKDVDGFHPISVGRMTIGAETFLPCTPHGVIEMMKRSGIEIAGKHAVVIGRSNIVGKPVAMLLLQENATVSICHSRTPNMMEMTKQADILIVGVGKPNLITRDYVKPGAVVIDVGINRLPTGKLAGDVAFDEVSQVAGAITPVPGGVGPMTITMLLVNTLQAATQRTKG